MRVFGGVRQTGLADVLSYPPSVIPTFFNTLFPLSGLGSLSFLLVLAFFFLYLR